MMKNKQRDRHTKQQQQQQQQRDIDRKWNHEFENSFWFVVVVVAAFSYDDYMVKNNQVESKREREKERVGDN